jgi:hypothetical protein
MKVIPETRCNIDNYLHIYYYHWVDTSTGGLLILAHEGITDYWSDDTLRD